MITPDFKLTQEEDELIVAIRVPYVKISACEVYVEKNRFTFYLQPYFLKLQFAQDLQEGDESVLSSIYDHSTYIVKFRVKKLTPGEQFQDLDLVSKLFEKKPKRTKNKPVITVVNSTVEGAMAESKAEDQPLPQTELYGYGFDGSFDDFFDNHQEELHELADLDPSSTPTNERLQALFMVEARKFDPDHYLCNFFDSKAIDQLIAAPLSLIIDKKPVQLEAIATSNLKEIISQKVFDDMVRIGNREHLLTKPQTVACKLMLVQLLFAYLYDLRTMDWENSCESGWTINKLCPFLSGFVYHDSLADCLLNLYRRVMIYPLYRNYKLAVKVHKDLIRILENKLFAIKLVAEVKYIFEKSDPRYLLNILYIDDLIVFAQNITNGDWGSLLEQVSEAKVSKNSLQLMLEQFEAEGLELEAD